MNALHAFHESLAPVDERPGHQVPQLARPRLVGAITSVLAVVAVLLSAAAPSSAHSWQNFGRPGSVQLKTVEGYGTFAATIIRVPGRYVYRSPATTGSQHVVLAATIYTYSRYTNRWPAEQSLHRAATIPAGASRVWIPAIDFEPYSAGDYTVDIAVSWRTVYTRVILGSTIIREVHASDYSCMAGESTLGCRDGRVIGGRGSIFLF